MTYGRVDAEVYEMIDRRNQRLTAELQRMEEKVREVKALEEIWHRLKFVVLESNPSGYFRIRSMFNNHRLGAVSYPMLKQNVFRIFYDSLAGEVSDDNMINLLTHIWGYLKKHVVESERDEALDLIGELSKGNLDVTKRLFDLFADLHARHGKRNLMDPLLEGIV